MDKCFTQNRELSWLKFNERVLFEAADQQVPLLERLKFISIFSNNLDEFFMIRVGSLFDLHAVAPHSIDARSNMKPKEQLKEIYQAVKPLYEEKLDIYKTLQEGLQGYDVKQVSMDELSDKEEKIVKEYFKEYIFPILSPQIIDSHHPFPHIQNKVQHIGTILSYNNEKKLGIIPFPASLPQAIFLPGVTIKYVLISDILHHYVERIFSIHQVLEKTVFCITRNADITPDDELGNVDLDFKIRMKTLLKKRKRLGIVRLENFHPISKSFMEEFCHYFKISEAQIFNTVEFIDISVINDIAKRLPPQVLTLLEYRKFEPQPVGWISEEKLIAEQVKKEDIILSYPYETMDPFLRLMGEAAVDSSVLSIKITIYRLANRGKLVEHLCLAAENGKDVTVLIELRARFDEQNNIEWSEQLEESGCKIIYGFANYKVHSKICLITKKGKRGIEYITQVGTGNYNEKTAKLYTDLSLITANYEIGKDTNEFFKNMGIGNLEGNYSQLLVAPISLKKKVIEFIDNEIEKGKDGYVRIKINSLTDMDIIEKFKEASCAGVKVELIVRGICCLIPGIPNVTENIHIINVVGRFLEHSRVYCFGKDDSQIMFLSSADFMTRNTERRVEVGCPILEVECRKKISEILDLHMCDGKKGRMLGSDGNYHPISSVENNQDSQEILMINAQSEKNYREETLIEVPKKGLFHRLFQGHKKI